MSRLHRFPAWSQSVSPWAAALGLAMVLAGAGCGGGGEEAPPPPPPAAGAAKAKPKAKGAADKAGGGKSESLETYRKIEQMVNPEEAKTIRHQFKERDFSPDPQMENRDPFRSYVLGSSLQNAGGAQSLLRDTEQCRKDRQIATNFGVRDLRLSAILAEGTKRYAMFQDSSDFGHFVMRGDCVGKEKARVVEIGAGFVRFEFLPEVAPGQPPRASETFDVQLFPDEIQPQVKEGGA